MSEETTNYLAMSDEDFAQAMMQGGFSENNEGDSSSMEAPDGASYEGQTTDTEQDYTEQGGQEEEETSSDVSDLEGEATTESEMPGSESEVSGEIDYEAAYKQIFSPVKANGKNLQAKSVDDVLQLMQMGANYAQKMGALKPRMKAVKLLEKHELLDEGKLNYLIDLSTKNPAAIAKLLQDAELDPMEMDVEAEAGRYSPSYRTVTDNELTMDEIIEGIQDTPTFSKTVDVISRQWDGASRESIGKEPKLIQVLNNQIADGTFDKVWETVEYERNFGRLSGLSDFEAYYQVGEAMYKQGQLGGQPPAQDTKPAYTHNTAEVEDERKQRKKSASPAQGKKASVERIPVNVLEMPDDVFLKKFPGLMS